jgi:type II secretory pathway pseudopilin PulG
MDKPRTTPKDFFVWAGAMIALYWAAISFVTLIFTYIDYAFPNTLSYLSPNPYDSGIGFNMASIVVFLPVYMLLAWLIRRDIVRDPSRKDIWVRRWALILTLFVAGATMAGDLVTVLAKFFGGEELTGPFVLKVVVIFAVAAIAFMHFIADYWGYWEQWPSRRRSVCVSVGVLAALAIVAGFVLFGTPAAARQYRMDEQRVNDLQSIQSQTTYYYQAKQKLPASLADLTNSISGFVAPTDPSTGAAYEYRALGARSFELCATFSRQSFDSQATVPESVALGTPSGRGFDTWAHGEGRTCFTRTIDPQLYPPIKNAPAQ